MSPPTAGMTNIIFMRQKNSCRGGRADHLARGLANRLGQLRIVDGARQHQRAYHGRDNGHGLFMRGRFSPIRELALDEAHELLDAPADGAAHVLMLPRYFAARSGDGAAQSLLGRLDVTVGEIGLDQSHQLFAGLSARERARHVLGRLDAGLLRCRREQRIARSEMGVEPAMRKARVLHHLGDADALVTVLANGARRRAQDALAGLLLLGRHMTVIIFKDQALVNLDRSPAYGSCESIRMKAMRQGCLPRFTQAWLVACCTTTSPALRCT